MPSRLDAASRRLILARVAEELRRGYVFRERGAAVAAALECDLADGSSPHEESDRAWIRRVNTWLRDHSADPHLGLRMQSSPRSPQREPVEELAEAFEHPDLVARRFGFEDVRILEGNIGKLEIRLLAPLDVAEATARAALAMISETNAVILDLRNCPGGSSEMVAFVAGYFLPRPQPLCSLVDPSEPAPWENWSVPHAVTRPHVPLVALIGPRTASAAESLVYDLQRFSRLTAIGEPSCGAAHAIRSYRIHPSVRLLLPYARAVDPQGRNWQRTGVQPDVPTDAKQALPVALRWLKTSRGEHP